MDRKNFSEALAKYAAVIVKVGLNLQPGQRLNLRADVEVAPLVRAIVKAAYQAGVYYVDVMWDDELTTHIRLQNASKESISLFPNWRKDGMLEFMQANDATLLVRAEYPDLFDDIGPEIVSIWRNSRFKHLQPAMELTRRNELNWCGVASASPAWAKKVFPDLSEEEALEKLWEAIFQSCRVDVNNPIEAWQKHIQDLTKRKDFLNAKHFTALHYYGSGTNLTVGLPEQHLWTSAAMESKRGILFVGNLPTEEVFTMPHREKVNGYVTATRPFSVPGSLIENFTLTFENGSVVNAIARTGEENLQRLLNTDEGARRLGEVALVPHSSPVSQRNHHFFSILYDENAASHMALGNTYRFTMRGGTEMSDDEFQANGGNRSLIHMDFMIGSGEINIDGIRNDGSQEPIMRAGEWAFDA